MSYDREVALYLVSDACSEAICTNAKAALDKVAASGIYVCLVRVRKAADASGIDSLLVPLFAKGAPIAFDASKHEHASYFQAKALFDGDLAAQYADADLDTLLDLGVALDTLNVPPVLVAPIFVRAAVLLNALPEADRRAALRMEDDEPLSVETEMIRDISRRRTQWALAKASGQLAAPAVVQSDDAFEWPKADGQE